MALPALTNLLTQRDEMIAYMEEDLMTKAQAAYSANSIGSSVYGIFSLDDLEEKEQSEIGRQLVVGVGYAGCEPAPASDNRGGPPNQVNATVLRYKFLILIAIPVDNGEAERYSATKLLTILRTGVAGKTIAGDRASRTWTLVSEAPRIAESTSTMLYYAQLWRVDLPNIATTS